MKKSAVLLLVSLAVLCFARPAQATKATEKAFIENWAIQYSGAPAEGQFENMVVAKADLDTQSDEEIYADIYKFTPADILLADMIINAPNADSDNDGFSDNIDCAPNNPAINPGATEVCNGVDDNCIGGIDENLGSSTCGVGACFATVQNCVGGVPQTCTPGSPTGTDQNCNGIDEDCDGTNDDGYVSQTTSCGVGACKDTGSTSCVSGSVQDSCSPGTPSSDANCDGIDNDCSGTADEDYVSQSTSCGVGACSAAGNTSCVSGGVVDSCTPGAPVSEIPCNGIDDNCNGATDEGSGTTITYYLDADNDTFGKASITQEGSDCFPIPGYVTDNTDCNDADPSIYPGAPELCNGFDDDCNDVIDNGFESQFHFFYFDSDNDGYGNASQSIQACAAPSSYKDNSSGFDCNDNNSAINPAASDATCDGIDNNCDTNIDEGYVPDESCFLPGACAVENEESSCSAGVETPCETGTPSSDANCDGIDNDCSGTADEDYVSQSTSCGVGACTAAGSTSCVSGGVVDSCTPGAPSSDANCDGIDNNCSGTADEDYVSQSTSCGVGACSAAGNTSCVSGGVVDSCTPGSSTAEVCNGIDDNCDGEIDDGLTFKTYYMDADFDHYGNADNSTVACEEPEGYVDNSTGFDCNDDNADINPGAAEVCGDGIDNNCDNLTDDNCSTCTDADGDGYFVGEGCTPVDCDDSNWEIREGCEAAPCSLKIIPKQIFKVLAFVEPIVPYIIIASKESGINFGSFSVSFPAEGITPLPRIRIGQRIIIGSYLVNPFKVEKGETTAEVEIYGVNPQFWCAGFTVQ